MTEVGTIKMKTPGGRDSSISVSINTDDIGVHFKRSSEGELFVRLTRSQACQLGDLLRKASETKP